MWTGLGKPMYARPSSRTSIDFDRHPWASARRIDDGAIAPLKRAIVLQTVVFTDRTGRAHVPVDIARDDANAPKAPVYTSVAGWLGSGVVGRFQDVSRRKAPRWPTWPSRSSPERIRRRFLEQTKSAFAHRIDEESATTLGSSRIPLPPARSSCSKSPTLWEAHRDLVIGGLAVFGLDPAVLAILLFHTAKRRQADKSCGKARSGSPTWPRRPTRALAPRRRRRPRLGDAALPPCWASIRTSRSDSRPS